MCIDVIPNRKSPPAVLLRECYRKDGKVRKHTMANLSALPQHIITALRSMLKGGTWVPYGEGFAIERSRPHGALRRAGWFAPPRHFCYNIRVAHKRR